MSFLQDKQIRRYVIFLAIFALVTLCAGGLFVIDQSDAVRSSYIEHDEAIASSLLEQGVPKDVIANALTNTETSQGGIELLAELGIESQAAANSLPYLSHFQRDTLITVLIGCFAYFSFRRNACFLSEKEKAVSAGRESNRELYQWRFFLSSSTKQRGSNFLYFCFC